MNTQDHIAMMIISLSKTFPIRVCDWLMAGLMVSWGVAAFNLTHDQWNQPYYSGLARIGDNHLWGTIVFAIGCARIVSLFRNGGWRPSPHLRAIGAFLACFVWLQISLGLFYSDMPSLGIAIYPWLLAADIYNVFRASHDARTSDDRARYAHVVAEQGRQQSASAPCY